MAIGVIVGLASSTVLSLVFGPAVYLFVDSFEQGLKPALGCLITRRRPGEAPIVDDEETLVADLA